MATPMAAPVSMVSYPKSLHIRFSRAMVSRSSMPRLDPSRPRFSYSMGEQTFLPSRSGKMLEHFTRQPTMQAWEVAPSPPRSSMVRCMASALIFSYPSKKPVLKFR